MTARRIVAVALVAIILGGCAAAKENLPPYHWVDTQTAIRDLSARAYAVKTMSAEGTLTLIRPAGDSVRLDAAVAMQPPDRLRLRAWKFNQSVFDLTLNRDGVFLITPEDSSLREKIHAGGVSAAQLARTWAILSTTFFDSPDLQVSESRAQLLITSRLDHQTVVCEVDRLTLTPRKYVMSDPDHRQRFTLSLRKYVDHAGVFYPHEIIAASDAGRIEIDLRDVDLNSSLAPGAFHPPRRAEKLP